MPRLHFKGRSLVENHHLAVPFHELRAVPGRGLSESPSLHDNLLVHGDNLAALKALMPTLHRQVKCIYVDPPYNTGNENWVYNDNVNSPMMREWFGKTVDRDDLTRHDKWCCMMMPRLRLLRELLRDDGAIFVSVDDNEVHHLRALMDEVFGEENFVGTFVWEGAGKNDARFISVGHDYVLTYARSGDDLKLNRNRWRVLKEGTDAIIAQAQRLTRQFDDDFERATQELRDWFSTLSRTDPSWQHRHYRWIDAKGVYFAGDISWPGGGGPRYNVQHPLTQKPVSIPARGWVFSQQETMIKKISEDRVHFGPDESSQPKLKRYLHEMSGQVLTSVFYQDRRGAGQKLRRILRDSDFEYPKDDRVLRRLLEAVTDKDSIVLDSFAGSGTTAHAVLALNKQDGGNRRFVLIECEDYADSLTAERIRRVARGVPDAKDETLRNGLGGSFSYFELGAPMRQESLLEGSDLPSYEALAGYIFFTATGEEVKPGELDVSRCFVGATATSDVYLIYEPSMDRLKELALNLDFAKALPPADGRKRIVFAPAKYLDECFLHQYRITFCQLPFEIFRVVGET